MCIAPSLSLLVHVCPYSLCVGCHLQVLLSVWLTHTRHWCRFLIDTFGRELLNEGSGVLDVAGGKGELSFELVNLNGINATVVEPRALQLWRQHKWMLVRPHPLHSNCGFKPTHTHRLRLRLPVEGLGTCGATCLLCLDST